MAGILSKKIDIEAAKRALKELKAIHAHHLRGETPPGSNEREAKLLDIALKALG